MPVAGKLDARWIALMRWAQVNPNSRIHDLQFQDGIPQRAFSPTPDGIGERSILFEKVAREMGIIK